MALIINGKNTSDYYGMVDSHCDIGEPMAKTNMIDIVGGDGVLDMTEAFGKVNYSNRQMILNFSKVFYGTREREAFKSLILNEIHGKRGIIILEQDNEYQYEGRMTATFAENKNILKIVIRVEANPYKLKRQKTIVNHSGNGTVTLMNNSMRTVPTIITTAETKIVKGTRETNLSAGRWVIPEFELVEGANAFTITTSGKVTFEYQEGAL